MKYDELIQTTKEKTDALYMLLADGKHPELCGKVTLLKGLLDAPEIGLVTWNSAVCALLTRLDNHREELPAPIAEALAALQQLAPDGAVS